MSPTRIRWRSLVGLLAVLLTAASARAGTVSFDVSARETYVGAPIEFKVTFVNVKNETTPAPPTVVNGQVVGVPHRGTFHSSEFTRGRFKQKKEVTYTWRIRPIAAGRMIVTPTPVTADGKVFETDPFEVVVVKSDTGDLLFAEVIGATDSVYLGEPLDLRLRIWIKPFRDRRQGTLGENHMWSRVDHEESQLGIFGTRIQELAQKRRRPGGREVLREDDDGAKRSYYLYEIPVRAWPDRAGMFDPGLIVVVVRYPVRVVRDVFDLRVTRDRPVVAEAAVPPIEILAPPEAGRPPWFNGAVGEFTFQVSARPTDVAVGDPITITMTVRDRTDDRVQLEVLQPPPLARVTELTESFRIPSDPLAGEINGRAKQFNQTLRARSSRVKRIPPIPFTFFDPDKREYVTVHSAAVPLTVAPAAAMSMADVVGGEAAAAPTELTAVNAGLLANAIDAEDLLASTTTPVPPWWLAVLAAPPVLFVMTVVAQRRAHRVRHDRGWVRQRRARREALHRLSSAARVTGDEQAHRIGDAISGYVADRCNLPAGAVTRAEVVRTLRDGSVKAELVEEAEDLLAAGEAARYAGAASADNGDLPDRARKLIDRLERERIR